MPWKLSEQWSIDSAIRHNKKLIEHKELVPIWIMQANKVYSATKSDASAIIAANSLIKKITRTTRTKKVFMTNYERKLKQGEKQINSMVFAKTALLRYIKENVLLTIPLIDEKKFLKMIKIIKEEVNL